MSGLAEAVLGILYLNVSAHGNQELQGADHVREPCHWCQCHRQIHFVVGETRVEVCHDPVDKMKSVTLLTLWESMTYFIPEGSRAHRMPDVRQAWLPRVPQNVVHHGGQVVLGDHPY